MPFAWKLGFIVKAVQPNQVIIEMPIIAEEHANLLGVVHGGVLMALTDTAMGFACANQGSLPTTIDMNINFIKSIEAKGTIKAIANVIHHGRNTIVAEAEVFTLGSELAAKARGTFFVIGNLEELAKEERNND
jgi:acyl-CoA thioesterase